MSEATDRPRSDAVPRHARVDVIGGAIVIFIAGLIWYGAIELNVGQLTRLESGAMPKALSILLFAAGCGVMAKGLMQRDDEAERLQLALGPASIVVIAMLIFGLFIRGGDFGIVSTPQLGLTVVGPLTVFIAGCATPNVRPGELLVTAFGLTAALLLIFADLLGVGVPVFPKFLQNAIPSSLGPDTATRLAYGIYGVLAAVLYAAVFGLGGDRRG
ncbi:hypothetical protein ABID19_004530 [Mesorhizobium robiniae]|uniref:DUF1468 domain-containing protein n=1 Tax=Mesorhizobium robiniae TaxID=559315 RepID=A0ABV2GT73_9HYPH